MDQIFKTFTIDFQLLLFRLKRIGFLWLLLQIFNYYHFAKGNFDFIALTLDF